MKVSLSLLFLFFVISVFSQSLPDSIIIIKKTYVNSSSGEKFQSGKSYRIYQKEATYFYEKNKIATSNINHFISELESKTNDDHSLTKYGIDTSYIKANPEQLLKLYSSGNHPEWNKQQKEYIFKKLTDVNLLQKKLDELLLAGCCYSTHVNTRSEYLVSVYKNGLPLKEIKSRKYSSGYKMPWTTSSGDTLYNYNIEGYLNSFIPGIGQPKEPLSGNELLKTLVNSIVNDNLDDLRNEK